MAMNDLDKLRQDVGFLSTASPQQLNTVGQMLQQGHRSDAYEPLAFLIANNMQREMRQPNPQAPQQTILQQRLAELQGQASPMMGGVPNVGPNQMALQQTAIQNPNTAGLAAAPENTNWTPQQLPPTQQGLGSIPGAATGGLVSFAEGGEVRGFLKGGSTYDPEAIEQGFDEADQDLESQTGAYDASSIRHAAYKGKEMPEDRIVHEPAPGSSAAKNSQSAPDVLSKAADEMIGLYGPSYAMSPELQQKFDQQLKSAEKDKWLGAISQGLGSMLSAQTPFIGQAAGQGLLGAGAGWQQGSKEEADLQKQMLALRLGAEKEAHADRRAAVGQVYKTAAESSKLSAEQRFKHQENQDKLNTLLRMTNMRTAGKGEPTQDQKMSWLNDEKTRLMQDKSLQTAKSLGKISDADIERMAIDNVQKRIDKIQGGALGGLGGIDPNARNALDFMGYLSPTGALGYSE